MRSGITDTGRPDGQTPGRPSSGRAAAAATARRMRAGAAAVTLLAAFGLLSACGGSHGGSAQASIEPSPGSSLPGMPGASGSGTPSMPAMTMTPGTTGSAHAPGGASAPAATGDTVAIKGFAFAPAALTVKAGTTVTWTNQDSDAHTVTSTGSGGPLNSKAMNTGDTFRFTFTKAGTYAYLCTIHPFMTATVTVTP